jgi:hypothetical protein
MMADVFDEAIEQQSAIRILVEKARADDHSERRGSQRYPFFRPVIVVPKHHRPGGLSAYARDISHSGIGLILFWPLETGPVELAIRIGEDEEVTVTGHVHWCQPCGQGWYSAGICFTGEEPDGFELPPTDQ